MRTVHLYRGHVALVYWIDTVYVQKIYQQNLAKRQCSSSKEKNAKKL